MNGAEFQCSREYLGLSAQWVGSKLNVDRRTVYRWEQGKTALPSVAAAAMQEWLNITARTVSKVTLNVLESDGVSPLQATPDLGEGHLYPPSWQRMLCARVAERTGVAIEWAAT
jgi:DNA-binding XRE family transcriptional regulator